MVVSSRRRVRRKSLRKTPQYQWMHEVLLTALSVLDHYQVLVLRSNDCRMTRRRAIMLECAMQLHVRTCTASCRSSTLSQTGAVANRCQLGHRSNRNTIESVDFDSRRPWGLPQSPPQKSSSSLPFIPHPRSLDSSLRCGLLLS